MWLLGLIEYCMKDSENRAKEKGVPFIWDAANHECKEVVAPNTLECANDNLMEILSKTN